MGVTTNRPHQSPHALPRTTTTSTTQTHQPFPQTHAHTQPPPQTHKNTTLRKHFHDNHTQPHNNHSTIHNHMTTYNHLNNHITTLTTYTSTTSSTSPHNYSVLPHQPPLHRLHGCCCSSKVSVYVATCMDQKKKKKDTG